MLSFIAIIVNVWKPNIVRGVPPRDYNIVSWYGNPALSHLYLQ